MGWKKRVETGAQRRTFGARAKSAGRQFLACPIGWVFYYNTDKLFTVSCLSWIGRNCVDYEFTHNRTTEQCRIAVARCSSALPNPAGTSTPSAAAPDRAAGVRRHARPREHADGLQPGQVVLSRPHHGRVRQLLLDGSTFDFLLFCFFGFKCFNHSQIFIFGLQETRNHLLFYTN